MRAEDPQVGRHGGAPSGCHVDGVSNPWRVIRVMSPGFVIPLLAKSDIFGCLVLPCASSGVDSGGLADCQAEPTEI
jgi:hypothetical protein